MIIYILRMVNAISVLCWFALRIEECETKKWIYVMVAEMILLIRHYVAYAVLSYRRRDGILEIGIITSKVAKGTFMGNA